MRSLQILGVLAAAPTKRSERLTSLKEVVLCRDLGRMDADEEEAASSSSLSSSPFPDGAVGSDVEQRSTARRDSISCRDGPLRELDIVRRLLACDNGDGEHGREIFFDPDGSEAEDRWSNDTMFKCLEQRLEDDTNNFEYYFRQMTIRAQFRAHCPGVDTIEIRDDLVWLSELYGNCYTILDNGGRGGGQAHNLNLSSVHMRVRNCLVLSRNHPDLDDERAAEDEDDPVEDLSGLPSPWWDFGVRMSDWGDGHHAAWFYRTLYRIDNERLGIADTPLPHEAETEEAAGEGAADDEDEAAALRRDALRAAAIEASLPMNIVDLVCAYDSGWQRYGLPRSLFHFRPCSFERPDEGTQEDAPCENEERRRPYPAYLHSGRGSLTFVGCYAADLFYPRARGKLCRCKRDFDPLLALRGLRLWPPEGAHSMSSYADRIRQKRSYIYEHKGICSEGVGGGAVTPCSCGHRHPSTRIASPLVPVLHKVTDLLQAASGFFGKVMCR